MWTVITSKSSRSAIPAALWGDLGVDVVLESTGFFTARDNAEVT